MTSLKGQIEGRADKVSREHSVSCNINCFLFASGCSVKELICVDKVTFLIDLIILRSLVEKP